ncbi:adenylyl-sulfate kinase [Undibacterium luofuense]|uniref:adenylyl-sulfate kinase n=1 Tax=Undibacterium luofuense TaxID=2828733 RepID=UPI0030EB2052
MNSLAPATAMRNLLNEIADRQESFGRFIHQPAPVQQQVVWHPTSVIAHERHALFHQQPVCLWMTGLSAAGKSTIAYALEKKLLQAGHACVVLDGDNLRHHLCSDLGFTEQDRRENLRRAAEVAHLFNEAGMIVITAFISPSASDRAMARAIIGDARFVEVYVDAASAVCEERDPKGLYQRARKGEIPNFTGVSAPYDIPLQPEIVLKSDRQTVGGSVQVLFDYLSEHSFSGDSFKDK